MQWAIPHDTKYTKDRHYCISRDYHDCKDLNSEKHYFPESCEMTCEGQGQCTSTDTPRCECKPDYALWNGSCVPVWMCPALSNKIFFRYKYMYGINIIIFLPNI